MKSMPTDPQGLLRWAQSPEGKREPHLAYGLIRDQVPIWRDEDSGMWYVFGWADCYEVLRSKRFVAPDLIQQHPLYEVSPSLQFLADGLPNLDAPHHTRLRGQVQRSFSAPVIKRSMDYVEEVIDENLNRLAERNEFDIVEDYAARIPNTVICEMLGVPREDHLHFGGWLAAQFRLLSPIPPSVELLAEIDASTQKLVDYMADLIAERTRNPRTDIISELVKAQEGIDDPLSVREMTVTTAILLAGGSDTTKTGIVLGARQLLANPSELQRMLDDEKLEASAFEEVMRTSGAVILANSRKAIEPVEIGGKTIAAGEFVVPVVAAANRDPNKFDDPNRFDVARSPNQHIAFGGGIHVCIGNMMARMVGGRAMVALLRAFPNLVMLDDGYDVNPQLVALQGLQSLRVQRSKAN